MKIFEQNKILEDNYWKIITKIGIFASCLFITTCAVWFYSPVIGIHANESLNSKVTVDVDPVASLTTNVSEIYFDITPTSAGTFDSDSIVATVSTNSLGGYELYFSSEDDSTDMTHSDFSINDVIASDFNGTVTSSTMATDKWGYSLDNTNFSKIPTLTSNAIIRNLDHLPSVAEKNTTVYFGAKVSTSLASGSYSKRVKFTVVAHATPGPTLFDIDDMQDMTSEVCAETTTPNASATSFDWDGSHRGDTNYVPRKSLRDSRDGNYYLVSKLADGNCWMSQSLALDLTSGTAIVASTTTGDTISVTPNNTTQTTTGITWSEADNNWRSYKPQASENETYYQSGTTMSSSPSGSGVTYDWEKAGNYYNWYAATAGTGTSSMTDSDATASICPKGWRLPSTLGAKSYRNLITAAYHLAASSTDGNLALRSAPLNFNLSGYYYYSNGAMRSQGTLGFYWFSTAYSFDMNAYATYFGTSNINLQDSSRKGYGYSVRCVAI